MKFLFFLFFILYYSPSQAQLYFRDSLGVVDVPENVSVSRLEEMIIVARSDVSYWETELSDCEVSQPREEAECREHYYDDGSPMSDFIRDCLRDAKKSHCVMKILTINHKNQIIDLKARVERYESLLNRKKQEEQDKKEKQRQEEENRRFQQQEEKRKQEEGRKQEEEKTRIDRCIKNPKEREEIKKKMKKKKANMDSLMKDFDLVIEEAIKLNCPR